MRTLPNGWDYDTWRIRSGGWGFPDLDIIRMYSTRRIPLPNDLREKRREHMVRAYNTCHSYTWVARMYGMNKEQVRRIINNLPNNP